MKSTFTVSLSSYLSFLPRYKVVAKSLHGELHGVPQLVAEVAVTKDTVDIQVNIPACQEEMKGESKRDLSFTLLLVIIITRKFSSNSSSSISLISSRPRSGMPIGMIITKVRHHLWL